MKYLANQFKVTLIWFTEKGIGKRSFKKYKDAVMWAEQNLKASEISVRITGTLSAEGFDVGSNGAVSFGNSGKCI